MNTGNEDKRISTSTFDTETIYKTSDILEVNLGQSRMILVHVHLTIKHD